MSTAFPHGNSTAGAGPILLLGASTGGPGALLRILKGLPEHFTGTAVVVQHIDGRFLDSFADWLRRELERSVEIVSGTSSLRSGAVVIAGPAGNLVISHGSWLTYREPEEKQLYIPSIDTLFTSMAKHGEPGIAMLLTGMGEDGAVGLELLARRGWRTFVQKPEECVVSGMPQTALRLYPHHRVGTLEELAREVGRLQSGFPRRSYGRA